jgi:3',5'-nucleoside bisphosphate phosphatase
MKGDRFTLIKMVQKFIDLHTHTMYSDGIETPKILMQNLKFAGMDIIAKTDHDTLAGYEEAKRAAENLGLILIPGVEISDRDYHILALGFNPYDQKFNAMIQRSKDNQRFTTKQRIDLLHDNGVPITIEKVDIYFPHSRLGKHNILRTLYLDRECRIWLEANMPNTCPNEVFDQVFRKNGIAAEVGTYHNLGREEIINGVHDSGGYAFLAHGPKDVENITELYKLREIGIDGFEIQPNDYNKKFKAISYEDVERFANENHMFLTYGSDYHGACFPRRLLERGKNILSPELEERLLGKISKRAA